MASVVQKYFIVSGMVTRSSSHRRKKWSIAVRAVKITAVYSGMDIFCCLNSLEVRPSTLIKGRKNDIYTIFFLQYRSREIFRNSAWAEKQEFS